MTAPLSNQRVRTFLRDLAAAVADRAKAETEAARADAARTAAAEAAVARDRQRVETRTRGERDPGSIAWHQIAAGALAGQALRLLYGVRYTDMCAFRAIRRQALLDLGMREMTYGWNIEMQMRAAQAGLRIREIPVPYHRRTGGSSKVTGSLRGTLHAGARILATFCRVAASPTPRLHENAHA